MKNTRYWHKSFDIRSELFLDEKIIMPTSPNHNPTSPNQPYRRLPKSISSFLAGFKSAVNSKIDDYIDENGLDISKYNRNNHFFQPDYYDHIIHD
jgi:putative transposase